MKEKKRVLVLAYYYPPIGGGAIQRTVKLVKYLPDLGWEPYVLTVKGIYYHSFDSTPLKEVSHIPVEYAGSLDPLRIAYILRAGCDSKDSEPVKSFAELEKGGRDTSVRYATWQRIGKNLLDIVMIPDMAILWLPFAVFRGLSMHLRYGFDAIYSISPLESAHLAGRLISKITGLPWITDFSDIWCGTTWRQRLPYVARKINEKLEKYVLGRADALVLNAEPMYERVCREFPDKRKKSLLNNAFDKSDYETELPYRDKDDYVIVHIGNFSSTLRAENLIKGFAMAREKEVDFARKARMYLIGVNKQEDIELIRRMGLGDYVFDAGYVSYYDAVRCCKAGDLMVICKGMDINPGTVPGKFYVYIGAEKPILSITPLESTHRLGRELCNQYYPVSPEDNEGITEALLTAFHEKEPLLVDWEKAARFDYRNVTAEVARLLDRLVKD